MNMMTQNQYFFASLTRISDLADRPFKVRKLEHNIWATGDYVAAKVIGAPNPLYRVELNNGRMVEVMEGDHIVGAFGTRAATLEATGDWKEIGSNLQMSALTSAGLLGKLTSRSPTLPPPMSVVYHGHVTRDGKKLRMCDFVNNVHKRRLTVPVVLVVGTSMSAGKTVTGRVIVHELKRAGLNVVGAKLTGAGRYRDILSFKDAGADHIIDFVDAGLPSTVVSEAEFRVALHNMLSRISSWGADVLVVEAGASPLEPYNGAAAIEELNEQLRLTILCTPDPYAVVGVQSAFDLKPDFVSGPATNTNAGRELVEKLTGVPTLNAMDRSTLPELQEALKRALPELLG